MASASDEISITEPASDEVSLDLDEFVVTSDYDPNEAASLYGSVSSSVYAHAHEHGRRYHMFKYGRYPIPNDDLEQEREAMKHAMILELLDGELHLAPIGRQPQRILDLGTGMGEWAIEMGDKYPSATVIGVDLSPIQPVWLPPNVTFLVDDIEEDTWALGSEFEYVHMRNMVPTLRDPLRVLRNAFMNIKPGGWIELQDICPRACCDDGTMPADYPVNRFYNLLAQAFRDMYNFELTAIESMEPLLHDVGFRNIHHKEFHNPIGIWPKSKKGRLLGLYQRETLGSIVPAMAAKPLAGHGVPPEELDELIEGCKTCLQDRRIHSYIIWHMLWAQKPSDTL